MPPRIDFSIIPADDPAYAKGYRYRLARDYQIAVPVLGTPPDHRGEWLSLTHMPGAAGSLLTIREGYAWDGPSGPALDTVDFQRASLVHDALYNLIRDGALYPSDRPTADRVMRQVAAEDGMPAFRRWWVWVAVRLFGWGALRG